VSLLLFAANCIVLSGRFIDNKTCGKILDAFFNATFEGARHQRRVEKIAISE
jgi:ribose 5-phosphate isomerase B